MQKTKQIIGYCRISTIDQNEARQVRALRHYTDNIVVDRASGKDVNVELNNLLNTMGEGDELYVTELSRLGRSLKNNLQIIDSLRDNGVRIHILKENLIIDRDNFDSRSQFQYSIYSAVSELERALIRERQMEGIAIRQKRLGKRYNKHSIHRTRRLRDRKFRSDMKHKTKDYMKFTYNMSNTTYYNYRNIIIPKDDKSDK